MDLLLAFVIAMMVTMSAIPALARAAGRLHVVDEPGIRKVHTRPIPRVGGLAMAGGALLPLCLWVPLNRTLTGYLLAVAVLLVFGAWDDRVALRAGAKFAGQLIAVVVVIVVGDVTIDTLTLSTPLALPRWLGDVLTAIFLLGITNAINLADGLDGLAGGTTLLCCAAVALFAQNWGLHFDATLSIVLMGAILGFLRFNTFPARIFMGDAGSQFLGLSVGVLSILLTKGAATPLSTTIPLLLIGLPLLDTLIVMALRIHAGRSPFAADRSHIHHRLMRLGFDHHEAVIIIYAVQCLMLLLAWQLKFESDLLITGVFLGLTLGLAVGLILLERAGWQWHHASAADQSAVARLRAWLVAEAQLSRHSIRLACLCATVYFLGVALYAHAGSRDIGWLAVAGLVTLTLGALWRRAAFAQTWVARASLYVAVMVVVYLDQTDVNLSSTLHVAKMIDLPVLALSVAVSLRLSRGLRFAVTPLDLLLVFVAIALSLLPGLAGAPHNLGISAVKLVVMGYAVELIASVGSRLRIALFGATYVFYALVALRALAS